MKKLLVLIILCVGLMTTSAFGAWLYDSCQAPVGAWNGWHYGTDGETAFNNWVAVGSVPWPPGAPEASPPTGNEEVVVRYQTTVVTLNSNEDWTSAGTDANRGRLRIYNGAVLNETGGRLTNVGWMRIGESSGGTDAGAQNGTMTQSGGLFRMGVSKDAGKFVIGDKTAFVGSTYTISGGTLTYDTSLTACTAQIYIGDRGNGHGKMIVDGPGGTIKMKNLYVGTDSTSTGNVGVLQFNIGASGVSAIQLTGTTAMNLATGSGNSAELIITLTAAPPTGPILLVDNGTAMVAASVFNLINGAVSGAEGSTVSASLDRKSVV